MGLEWIKEILQARGLGAMPNANQAIAGLLNVRGEVLPVLKGAEILINKAAQDISLDLQAQQSDKEKRVVLIGTHGASLGLMVDSVLKIGSFDIDTAGRGDLLERGGAHMWWKGDFALRMSLDKDGIPVPLLNVARLMEYVKDMNRPGPA